MNIWVDADACPKAIKEIVFRAVKRTKTKLTLVSNQSLSAPLLPFIHLVQVPKTFDAADNYILDNLMTGDLVVTADVLLADKAIEKGSVALNPRGTLYTSVNIKQHLSMRNLHTELRGAGMLMGGPSVISKKEIEQFANGLDRYLTGLQK